jgi:hypothetical protein
MSCSGRCGKSGIQRADRQIALQNTPWSVVQPEVVDVVTMEVIECD